jgi:hypothetical protein
MNLTRTYIRQTLQSELSKSVVESSLRSFAREVDLVVFFIRYVEFNGTFAGAVAGLTCQLHFRGDLFRDRVGRVLQTRADEIASRVFYAAEDEYSATSNKARVTHRAISQKLLFDLCELADPTDQYGLAEVANSEILRSFEARVKTGYSVQGFKSDAETIRSLAFHAASEFMADMEFKQIDSFMQRNHHSLVNKLKSRRGPGGVGGFYWIAVHSVVEADHGEMALEALDLAYMYAPAALKREFNSLVAEGFGAFIKLHKDFFTWASVSSGLKKLEHRAPLCEESET